PLGPGLRHDVGVYQGAEVTSWYDPMIAKLIVHAADRPAAVARTREALLEYGVLGVRTNQQLLLGIASDEAFAAGETHTGFLEERAAELVHSDSPATFGSSDPPPLDVPLLVAAAFELTCSGPAGGQQAAWSADPWSVGGWRDSGTERRLRFRGGDGERSIVARKQSGEPDTWLIS